MYALNEIQRVSARMCFELKRGNVDDLLDGKLVCGAGGGGFLNVVLKKGVGKEKL